MNYNKNGLYDIYCVGMRVEAFVDEEAGEQAFEFEPSSNVRRKLFCTTMKGRWKFIITLSNVIGWCGSGYTTDCEGRLSIEFVNSFGPLTHKIRGARSYKFENMIFDVNKPTLIECVVIGEDNKKLEDESHNSEDKLYDSESDYDDDDELYDYSSDDYDTGVFSFHDHGDSYYPNCWYDVNMDIFEELPRSFSKRPVWVLSGDSGAGKSTFGYYLRKDYTIYETDSANNGNLPDEIWADIVIIGNKWKNITLDEVKKRLGDVEVISVSFEKGEKN